MFFVFFKLKIKFFLYLNLHAVFLKYFGQSFCFQKASLKKFFQKDTLFFINVPTVDFNLFKLKNLTKKGIEGMNWAHYFKNIFKNIFLIFFYFNLKNFKQLWIF